MSSIGAPLVADCAVFSPSERRTSVRPRARSSSSSRLTIREQQARTWFDTVHPDEVARHQQIAVDEAARVSPAYAARLRLRHLADAQALRELRGER